MNRTMKKERIALIEIGGSHDECLLTQMHAICQHGKEVLLITTPEIVARNPIFSVYVHEVFLVDFTKASEKTDVRRIWQKLKTEGIQLAVLNTAQGKQIRNLCLKALFHPIQFVGVVHTTRMFTESFTQKIIHRKIRKYFLLSDFLRAKTTPPKGVALDYFYPLRFATEPRIVEKRVKSIAIIGGVEERRKDLNGFLDLALSVREEPVHFYFIGKSDPAKPEVQQFLKAISDRELSEKVTTFDAFVSQEKFDMLVQNADLILPLVHPDTPSADQYFRNQISGAMTVSFAYKVPMLIHEAYASIEEMQVASAYYSFETFPQVLSETLETLDVRSNAMRNHKPYSVTAQEDRYMKFLES